MPPVFNALCTCLQDLGIGCTAQLALMSRPALALEHQLVDVTISQLGGASKHKVTLRMLTHTLEM